MIKSGYTGGKKRRKIPYSRHRKLLNSATEQYSEAIPPIIPAKRHGLHTSAPTATTLSLEHPRYVWTGKLRKVFGVCVGLLIPAFQPPKLK